MSATAETQEIGKKPATPRAVFILRFTSTIILWTVALLIAFSGFELAFWGLISAFGLISLWEFYGMLDQRGLPNFKGVFITFPILDWRIPMSSRRQCCYCFC